MSLSTSLSTSDLAVFFEPHHHELAARLEAMAGALAAAGDGLEGTARAAAAARDMARLGLYELLVPAGGERVDVRALCLVRELLGQVSPLCDAIFAVQGLGAFPVALAGQGNGGLLAELRAGAAIGAFALTEPEAGSDVASLRTTAEPAGNGRYRLRGDKTLISNVGIASHYVVFASTDPAAGRRGISAFLVHADAPGLFEEPIALGCDHPIGALRLDGCDGELLGDAGGGFRLAMRTLDTFRVTVGAAAVGMARRALDRALAHVGSRQQFGQPLAAQPVIQTYLADMATELDAARLLVLRAALTHDRSAGQDALRRRRTTETAMAKLYATEAAQRIIDHALQLLGGRGVVRGEIVEELYRAIRPLRIYEGTSEIQRLIIGRTMTQGERS